MDDPITECINLLDDIKSDFTRAIYVTKRYQPEKEIDDNHPLERRIRQIEEMKNKLKNYE